MLPSRGRKTWKGMWTNSKYKQRNDRSLLQDYLQETLAAVMLVRQNWSIPKRESRPEHKALDGILFFLGLFPSPFFLFLAMTSSPPFRWKGILQDYLNDSYKQGMLSETSLRSPLKNVTIIKYKYTMILTGQFLHQITQLIYPLKHILSNTFYILSIQKFHIIPNLCYTKKATALIKLIWQGREVDQRVYTKLLYSL